MVVPRMIVKLRKALSAVTGPRNLGAADEGNGHYPTPNHKQSVASGSEPEK